METQGPILKDQDRAKLDGIVEKMKANKESDENIQFVVNDFKKKYGSAADKKEASPEPVKKKETSDLAVSPSGSLETKPKPAQQSTPSESDTPPTQETVFDSIFGAKPKDKPVNKKKDFVASPDAPELADEKGSLLSDAEEKLTKGQNDQVKAKVHERIVNLRNNFFNASLTPADISLIPGDLGGMSDSQAAEAINNKTRNLKIWGNIAVMKGINWAGFQRESIDGTIKDLQKQFGDHTEEIKNLENKKAFLNNSITQAYNAEADKVSGDLIQVLKPSLGTKKTILGEFDGPIKYDPYTNTLDEKSQFYVRKSVDDYLNTHKNDVINFKTSGSTLDGKRNYPDIANRVVSYFNTVIPVQRAHDQVRKDFVEKHPQAKGLISHIEQINDHFTKTRLKRPMPILKHFRIRISLVFSKSILAGPGYCLPILNLLPYRKNIRTGLQREICRNLSLLSK